MQISESGLLGNSGFSPSVIEGPGGLTMSEAPSDCGQLPQSLHGNHLLYFSMCIHKYLWPKLKSSGRTVVGG